MTGRIHDIQISDRINPEEIQVHIGDEVRWVNARSAPVKIVFIDPLKENVSCQNGFVTGRFSREARATSITTIDANQFASLCFSAPGLYRYTARMESPLPGGEKNEPGTVRVTQ
jgi:plastocyanin